MATARMPALRACGLSTAKSLAVKDLARKALDGTVPKAAALHKLDDEAIVERLTEVRGIGRWTVEMMLMFRLGRLDVLPVDDFGVRKGFTRLAGLPAMVKPRELLAAGEPWRPYRSVAAWYLWRVVDGVGG
jgi:DNA-3-methyladenine glycosylase II